MNMGRPIPRRGRGCFVTTIIIIAQAKFWNTFRVLRISLAFYDAFIKLFICPHVVPNTIVVTHR